MSGLTEVSLRDAVPTDAAAMAAVQNAIHAVGLRPLAVTEAQVLQRYVIPPARIACTIAERQGRVTGFQSLMRAMPGNPYNLSAGWGFIGTHIHPDAGRSGLGRLLFARSLAAARQSGIVQIDAAIGADNVAALAYYQAMGFRPYDRAGEPGVASHRLDL